VSVDVVVIVNGDVNVTGDVNAEHGERRR